MPAALSASMGNMRMTAMHGGGKVGLPQNSTVTQRRETADLMRRQSTENLKSADDQTRMQAEYTLGRLNQGQIPAGQGKEIGIESGQVSNAPAGMMMGGNVGRPMGMAPGGSGGGNVMGMASGGWGGGKTMDMAPGGWGPKST
jgi:hypothetical protein